MTGTATGPATGRRVRQRCEELLAAELTYPFGPETAVYKVGGKIFAIFQGYPEGSGPNVAPTVVSLKCEPEQARTLVREHPAITPGYHLNKRHWISVDLVATGRAKLPAQHVVELLEDSYDIVVDSLPRARRPQAASDPSSGRSDDAAAGTSARIPAGARPATRAGSSRASR